MSILVVSVHADDGIFSCGEFIARQVAAQQEVTVLSLCSVAPNGAPEERAWQDRLNNEHQRACNALGARFMFGGFMDGKWSPKRDVFADTTLLAHYVSGYNAVLVPLGVHHPDHIYFADILHSLDYGDARVLVYEDLPYRVLYPEQVGGDLGRLSQAAASFNYYPNEPAANAGHLTEKLEACALYESQWSPPEGDAPRCCSAPERIWRVR